MPGRDIMERRRADPDGRRPQASRRVLVLGAIAGGLQMSGEKTAFGEEKHMTGDDPERQTREADEAARRIYEEWHAGFKEPNIDRVVALYAENAVIETPAILSVYPEKDDGILVGRDAIRDLFTRGLSALTDAFQYRNGLFFSNGRYLTWEYPRKTPSGAQVDLFESMDLENGLIAYHRVYWGWRGLKALIANREKAKAR